MSKFKPLSKKALAQLERDRTRQIEAELKRNDWRDELKATDWLFDGYPIRADDRRFADLDWSKAWIDMGPSISGNPGPYWHVPLKSGDTTHRLYPKLLTTKWLPLIRRAILEVRQNKGKP